MKKKTVNRLICVAVTATITSMHYAMLIKMLSDMTTSMYQEIRAKANEEFITSAYNLRDAEIYDGTNSEKYIQINGRKYYQGVALTLKDACVSFNVENIKSLSFAFGHLDNALKHNAQLEIYLN